VIAASLKDGTLCFKEGDKHCKTNTTMLEYLRSGKYIIQSEINSPDLGAPLPETFCFLDGSAFLNHIELARKARGAELPKDLYTIPLMYQGISAPLLGSNEKIPLRNFEWGLDFEAEIGVVLSEVPEGISSKDSLKYIRFLCLFNDWTYRNLLGREAETGFGFIQSKPASSFAPYLVSPDELNFLDGKLKTRVKVYRNHELYGDLDTSEMFFSFGDLIEFGAKTRSLPAGTIIGSGTISNKGGFGCIAEKRAVEMIEGKEELTSFLNTGEEIVISNDIFGECRNRIVS